MLFNVLTAATRSNTNKAVIDHLLTTLNRRHVDSAVYKGLATTFGWDTTDPDIYVLNIFLYSLNSYYDNHQQFPVMKFKYEDDSSFSYPDHSMLLNLHLLVAHMHYKYNGVAVTNQQWQAFALNNWVAPCLLFMVISCHLKKHPC